MGERLHKFRVVDAEPGVVDSLLLPSRGIELVDRRIHIQGVVGLDDLFNLRDGG